MSAMRIVARGVAEGGEGLSATTRNAIAMRLVAVCRRLHARGWVAACDGNASARVGDRVLITPGGRYKGLLRADEVAELDLAGNVLAGQPSSERVMHLEIYRSCPAARAVVHAHPPLATAWTIAFPEARELPSGAVAEVILAAGGIPFAPYARPGTPAVAEVIRPFLPEHRLLVLKRHGVVCWGETIDEAFFGVERVEHAATVLFAAEVLGGVTELPADEVAELLAARRRAGPRTL
jgi:L-fuculose-phosphate aldolase